MLYQTTPHSQLRNTLRSFVPHFPEREGICHGFALMWLQAAMTSDIALEKFYDRIRYALASQHIAHEVTLCLHNLQKKKRKHHDELREGDQMLIEMRAFFECMAMYQAPDLFVDFFNIPVSQTSIDKVFLLTRNQHLEEKTQSLSFDTIGPVCLSLPELKEYFFALEKIILSQNEIDEKIGFLISSDEHSIGIYYDVPRKKWAFINISDLNSKANLHQEMDTDAVAHKLYQAFQRKISRERLSFAIRTITTPCEKTAADFIALRTAQYEKMWAEDVSTPLLFLAAYDGQSDVVETLVMHSHIDVNTINTSTNATPLMAAIMHNHADVVQSLLTHPAIDIYVKNAHNETAYDIACESQQSEIIALFDAFTSARCKRKETPNTLEGTHKRSRY